VLLSDKEENLDQIINLKKSINLPEVDIQLNRLIAMKLLSGKKYKESLPWIKKIIDANLDIPALIKSYAIISSKNGVLSDSDFDKFIKIADKYPENIEYVILKSALFIQKQDYKEAEKILQNAHDKKISSSESMNLLAWIGLFSGRPLPDILEISLAGNKMSNFSNHAQLNTLAIIYAEMERISEAKQVFNKILEIDDLKSEDYYILARNAETLGLGKTALFYYSKINKNEFNDNDSTYTLARKRIKMIGKVED
jgi:tetratricopeptide (TPR) repeat protein